MSRYIRMFSFIVSAVGICLLTILFSHFHQSTISRQTVFAYTQEDQYVYLPIINKPIGPEYKIVFASDRNRARRVNDIYTMNMEGDNVRMLTNTPDIIENRPVWSPDGTMIAYTSGAEGQEEVFVMNANGSNQRNVSNSASSSDKRFVWSPDSSKLSFISDRTANKFDIFVVNIDGSGLTNLTQTTDADEWGIDWSPDGSKLVYLSDKDPTPYRFSGGDMITMDADGSNKKIVFSDTGWNRPAVWTPDSSKLTFSVYNDCIAIMNTDGTDLMQCFIESPIQETISHFLWNSTGSQLVFESSMGNEAFYIYDSEAKLSTSLNDGPTEYAFDWSADDSQIVGHGSSNMNYGIFVVDIDANNYKNLTDNTQSNNFYPNVSPIKMR